MAVTAALVAAAFALPIAIRHDSARPPQSTHPVHDVPPPVMAQAANLAAMPAAPANPAFAHGMAQASAGANATQAMPLGVYTPLQRQVFGFVNASNLGDPSVGWTSWQFQLLSTVAYFGLTVKPGDGTVDTNAVGWQVIYSQTMADFVARAHQYSTRVIVSFNARGDVCGQLMPGAVTNTINIAMQQVHDHNLDGVNIDYEGDDITCSNGLRARDMLVDFVRRLRAAMPSAYLAIDTYTGSAEDNQEIFNITGLGPYVDAFFVMAYDMDFANLGQPPISSCTSFCFNPISALNTYRFNVTSSMAQYTALVPASKVILGQPLYGRRGCVPNLTDAHQQPTTSSYPQFATPTYLYASRLTGFSNLTVHRDPSDGVSRWDTFWDTDLNCNREQYWDDTVSLGAKFDLANQDNIGGVGFFTLDYAGGAGELWNSIATHFTQIPGLPGSVAACAGTGSATVSWTAAPTAGPPVTNYTVTPSGGGPAVTLPASATFATVTGLTAGTDYTFNVRGVNANGAGLVASTATVTPTSTAPVAITYFTWFDNATNGMVGDNIHLLNIDATNGSSGCVTVSGKAVVPFSLAAGQEQHVTFPPNTIGGPVVVTVNAGPAVEATQRVQYFQSFNEVWASNAARATTTSYLNWFDKATPGMVGDNVHVVNPGTTVANVTVSLGALSQSFAVAPGGEGYMTFPANTIGGPVKITSDQPVLAAQRVQYYQSFNEALARGGAEASQVSYFNWFDRATQGMVGDNVHVLNPGATVANVTVTLPNAATLNFTVAPGTEHVATFPSLSIGGPVKIAADQPVLATQRVQYFQSFNEVASVTAAQGLQASHVMWFDKATAGMVGDNIHVLNPGTTAATVQVSLPGVANPLTLDLAPGQEGHVTFPVMTINGPVTITSNVPVLAAQRVQYFQSFNEVPAA